MLVATPRGRNVTDGREDKPRVTTSSAEISPPKIDLTAAKERTLEASAPPSPSHDETGSPMQAKGTGIDGKVMHANATTLTAALTQV